MMMTMTQVITLLMLKRLHVDPVTFSSIASITKNERIIGESTNGQITSEDISFAGKQSSCCLNKKEKGELLELSKFILTLYANQ